jgi:hypothetical protein
MTLDSTSQRTLEGLIEKLYAEARIGKFGLRSFGRMLIADEPEDVAAMIQRWHCG